MCQSAVNVDANLSLILGSVHSKQTETQRHTDRVIERDREDSIDMEEKGSTKRRRKDINSI